jgi:hypothetical protein
MWSPPPPLLQHQGQVYQFHDRNKHSEMPYMILWSNSRRLSHSHQKGFKSRMYPQYLPEDRTILPIRWPPSQFSIIWTIPIADMSKFQHLGHCTLGTSSVPRILAELVKKFPTFYRTWIFITMFPTACHLSLSLARRIKANRLILFYSHPF